jgi:hypothetical protein
MFACLPRPALAQPAAVVPPHSAVRAGLGVAGWAALPAATQARFRIDPAPGERRRYYGVMLEMRLSWLGWLCAQACRLCEQALPRVQGRFLPAQVDLVGQADGGVAWERAYWPAHSQAPELARSVKRADPGHEGLVEWMGGWVGMTLALSVVAGVLIFSSTGFFLRVGAWRMPIPQWFGPGHVIVRHADMGGGAFRFTLTADHPWFGRSIVQDGLFCDGEAGWR